MTGLVFQMLVVVIKIIEVLLCSKYSSKLLIPRTTLPARGWPSTLTNRKIHSINVCHLANDYSYCPGNSLFKFSLCFLSPLSFLQYQKDTGRQDLLSKITLASFKISCFIFVSDSAIVFYHCIFSLDHTHIKITVIRDCKFGYVEMERSFVITNILEA